MCICTYVSFIIKPLHGVDTVQEWVFFKRER